MKRNFYATIVLILISIFIVATEGSAAYYIDFWSLSHRIYEDGQERNRLVFALRDTINGYPTEDIVKSVEVTDPNGNTVSIENLGFHSEVWMQGWYDKDIEYWFYWDEFEFISTYGADVESELISGSYHLTVTDIDDNEYVGGYYDFNGLVDLPITSSRSFRTRRDDFGNIIWKWEVPYYLDPNLDTHATAIILIYDWKNDLVGEIYTRLPTHLGSLFVPREVLEKIPAEGKRFKLQIQLRDSGGNRSYSNDEPFWRTFFPF